MASGNKFVYAQSTINIGRSAWNMNHRWQGSVYHGDLVPVEITEVVPGDSMTYYLKDLTRTATPPIAPIMDNIYQSVAAFFVPKRLIWDKTKEFYGENTQGYGIQSEVLEPRSTAPVIKKGDVASHPRAIATYLGLVAQTTSTPTTKLNLNPVRAFLAVYNEWFRNQNFMSPYLWTKTQTGDSTHALATLGGSTITGSSDVPKVCKKLDRFTSCLPWSQKSANAVLLPLGLSAPVVSDGYGLKLNDGTSDVYLGMTSSADYVKEAVTVGSVAIGASQTTTTPSARGKVLGLASGLNNGLKADLSQASAANVNQLRLAFSTQRFLEQLARTGSKYREFIRGIFGVSINDTTAQMPEYLGGISFPINISQVLQTTGFAAGSTTTLGAPGANSVTAKQGALFSGAFKEPGYLVIVTYMKHDRTYGQGLLDLYRKQSIWDYYNPKFANIGEQAIKKYTHYFDGIEANDAAEFGFQEAYSDMRYIPDRVVGLLSPANSNSYDFWNLSEKFATAQTLNASFLTEDRANLVRCLSGGTSSPDYFVDMYFETKVVRPMPINSIPGLIDHH